MAKKETKLKKTFTGTYIASMGADPTTSTFEFTQVPKIGDTFEYGGRKYTLLALLDPGLKPDGTKYKQIMHLQLEVEPTQPPDPDKIRGN